MVFISEYVQESLDRGLKQHDIARKLGVGTSMVTAYKDGSNNPSLLTAIQIYKTEGIAFHPFGVANLKYEMEKNDA